MNVEQVSIHDLKIPFSRSVEHHLQARRETESIILIVRDRQGMCGFGEGTPRPYVTGERLEESRVAACTLARRVVGQTIGSRDALFDGLAAIGRSGTAVAHPAAGCALETALLDLWARREGLPLYRLFSSKSTTDRLRYSGVIPFISRDDRFLQTLELVEQLKLPALKLKVVDRSSGIAQLKRIRAVIGPDVDIRVDANGAFTPREALAFIEEAEPLNISMVEQPVAREDLDGLQAVSAASRIPVIADESMYTTRGPQYLIDNRICDGLNIRLSSCGGLLKARDLYRRAVSRKMRVVLGAHVGETAVLSLAGRHLAMLCPQAVHLEGSFSKYLLTADLVDTDVSFGIGGEAPAPAGAGLGMAIDPDRIARWSVPFAVLNA